MARFGRSFPIRGITRNQVLVASSANKTLAADPSSFALTGAAATPLWNRKVVAAAASYALTGTAASVLHRWNLSAAAGSYALTGTTSLLKKGSILAAAAGSYALTGSAASLLRQWLVTAELGDFALTGAGATPILNRTLAANDNSYSIVGADAALTHFATRIIFGDAGSYILTGAATSLLLVGAEPQPSVPDAPQFAGGGKLGPFKPSHFPRDERVQSVRVSGQALVASAGLDSGHPQGRISVSAIALPLTPSQGAQAGLSPGAVTAKRNLSDDELLILIEAA